ncbi:MAG TPA: prolipoprotein diacylglyceryl transferase [Mobilitalea sp.]|nr:prolipoprotein diacylglyceryl transferase [Mobilitalea sp.]
MKNELLTIGPFTLYGYGLMIAIGAISAYLMTEYRAKKKGLQYELIFSLFWWCLGGGILGAKLLYILTQMKNIVADPSIILSDFSEGFVVYGGIIGGILGGFLFCKRHKINFLKYFDIVMPSIALAQGFGRIGCLFAGCCYGEETNNAFSLVFHDSAYAPNNVHLIPTQPISSALNFLNFFALVFISKRIKADGQVAGFYLIFYSVGRFIIEFFRGDLERGSIGPLSTSQFISIFLFAAGLGIVIIRGIQGRKALKEQLQESTDELTKEQE